MNKKIIKRKLGLTELAKQLENVSKACKVKGYIYWFGELYENGEEKVLHEIGKKGCHLQIRCQNI